MNIKSEGRSQLNALTSLRFFAAFHVVLYHLYSNGYLDFYFNSGEESTLPHLDRFASSLLKTGYASVSLFFVLSGFILVHAHKDRPIGKWSEYARFYVARFSRVYPVYLFALLAMVPLMMFLWQSGSKSLSTILVGLFLNLTLVQSWVAPAALSWNAPGWSLSVEILFYISFPFIYSKLREHNTRTLMCFFWIVFSIGILVPCLYVVYSPDGVDPKLWPHAYFDLAPWLVTLKFFPIARLHEFVMGVATGIVFSNSKNLLSSKLWLCMSFAAMLAYVYLLCIFPNEFFPLLHNGAMAPLFALLIYALASSKLNNMLDERSAFVLLGKSSFSLYLIHGPVLLSVKHFIIEGRSFDAGLGTLLLILSGCISLSIFMFFYIEEPMRRGWQFKLNKVLGINAIDR